MAPYAALKEPTNDELWLLSSPKLALHSTLTNPQLESSEMRFAEGESVVDVVVVV